jgi:hypothetical protein
VFTNLTLFTPLSFKGGGKRFIERGFTPLLPTLPLPLLREGGRRDGLLNNLKMRNEGFCFLTYNFDFYAWFLILFGICLGFSA